MVNSKPEGMSSMPIYAGSVTSGPSGLPGSSSLIVFFEGHGTTHQHGLGLGSVGRLGYGGDGHPTIITGIPVSEFTTIYKLMYICICIYIHMYSIWLYMYGNWGDNHPLWEMNHVLTDGMYGQGPCWKITHAGDSLHEAGSRRIFDTGGGQQIKIALNTIPWNIPSL